MRARLPKLGRTARWILTIGIILIPIIVLGVTYGQHLADERGLRADIETANAQLSSGLHILAQREVVRNQTQAELQDDVHEITTEVERNQTYVWDNINGTVAFLGGVHSQLLGNTTQLENIDRQFVDVILPQLDNLTQQEFPYNYTQSIEIGDELFQAADDANVTISSYTSSLPHEETIDGVRYQVFSISLSVQGQVPNVLDFNIKVSQRFPDCDFKSVSIDMPKEEGGVASMSFDLEIYCYA